MLNISRIVLFIMLGSMVSACGVKGKLKTPAQIEQSEAKKAREEKKMQEDKAKENHEENSGEVSETVPEMEEK